MENFEQVEKEYLEKCNSLSQKEKAMYEHRLWTLWTLNTKEEKPRRQWLSDRFAGSQHEYDIRSSLLTLGKDADVLWERISTDMPIRTAVELMRQAKKLHVKGQSLSDLIRSLLEKYDAKKHSRLLPSGKVVKTIEPKATSSIGIVNSSVRVLVSKYADEELSGLDEYQVKQIKDELIEWVNDGLELFSRKVLKLRGDTKEEKIYSVIGKSRFNESLEILGLKVSDFVFGKNIDFKKVNRAYRLKSNVCHPDKHPGNEKIKNEWDLINQARQILLQYSEQMR